MNFGTYEMNKVTPGDACELLKSVPDDSADLVLLDPPFGIGFKYSHDFNDDPDRYLDMMLWVIKESTRIVKPGRFCFVYSSMPRLFELVPIIPKGSRVFAACKNFVQIRPAVEVQYSYDPVVFWKKEGACKNDVNFTGRDFFVANTANTSRRRYNDDVKFHSTPRPLEVILYLVEHFSQEGETVIDFFMGSGTTGVACKMLGRNFWGCEIDPEMADMAQKRIDESHRTLSANYFNRSEISKREHENDKLQKQLNMKFL